MNDKMDKEISELLFKNAFEEYENARCDEIIEKYKDTEPEYSEEHKRRMEKLFKKEKKSFCWNKFAKRAAMVVLAVFLSGALALQVEAVRIKIENWYYEITGEAIHIGNSVEDLPGYSETDMPIYALSDEVVESYGLNLTQEIDGKIITSKYKSLNGVYIVLKQFESKISLHLDNDDAAISEERIGQRTFLILENIDERIIYLEEQNRSLYIYTNLDNNKIKEIIENLVIKK